MNTFAPPINFLPQVPAWGQINFGQLRERAPGFLPATGYHIYCELRPVAAFEETEDDEASRTFVRIVDQYARMGAEAAVNYGLVLLELQGRVLHFFKPGEALLDNTNTVIDFVHEFTQAAYDELRDEMDDDWHGFASAFDHGRCILVNHASHLSDSTVSLGPSANNPAKRLFNAAPAGHVSVPVRLLSHPQSSRAEWVDINLKDRKTSPTRSREMLMERFADLKRVTVRKSDEAIQNFSAALNENVMHMTPKSPLRIKGASVRIDLDGFSRLVEHAFSLGKEAVFALALAFRQVMQYAEMIAEAHQPCIMLPWAGDCVTFLLPDVQNEIQRLPRWLMFSLDWLSGDSSDSKSPLRSVDALRGTRWAVGAARGKVGSMIAATSVINSHPFLFAGGWPQATAKKAQESACGDEVAIDTEDHQMLTGAAKKLFDAKNDDGFWFAEDPSHKKLKELAVQVTVSQQEPQRAPTINRPSNRPYYGNTTQA